MKRLWRYPKEHPKAFVDELDEAIRYITRIRFASLSDERQVDGVRMIGYRLLAWADSTEEETQA
jgi:hypothetical protein